MCSGWDRNWAAAGGLWVLLWAAGAAGGVLYVDAAAPAGGTGQTWGAAYCFLQDALQGATAGSEVWVAGGTYRPDQGAGVTAGDRSASFELVNGVAVYGGFPTGGGTWEERDPNAYETVWSGDLGGDDEAGFVGYGENSYHVVHGGAGVDASTVIDGCTITGGGANGGGYGSVGGGLYLEGASPRISRCRIAGNYAGFKGGGAYNAQGDPNYTECVFERNAAAYGGGMSNFYSGVSVSESVFRENVASASLDAYAGGGAISSATEPFAGLQACSFRRCRFADNAAVNGGAIENHYNIDATLSECVFTGNYASEAGGAVYSKSGCTGALSNCVMVGNGSKNGGAIYNSHGSSPALMNCTIHGNVATSVGAGIYNYQSGPALVNCIVWGNQDSGGTGESSQIWLGAPTVNYCCVEGWTGGLGGTGNIGLNPRFVRSASDGGDGWGVGGNDDYGDLHLRGGSPGLDAGDPASVFGPGAGDLDGEGRVQNGRVDMGAYEGAGGGGGDGEEPTDELGITKLTVAAGKERPRQGWAGDSFTVWGTLAATVEALAAAEVIEIQAGGQAWTIDTSDGGFKQSSGKPIFSYKGSVGGITQFKADLSAGTFQAAAKNVDLTGLDQPVVVSVRAGAYYGRGTAGEEVVNSGKGLPVQLLMGAADRLTVDKVRVKANKDGTVGQLTASGRIAAAGATDLRATGLRITWNGEAFDLGGGDFVIKSGQKYIGMVKDGAKQATAAFDFGKCTFSILLKNPGYAYQVSPGQFGLWFGSFAQTAAVEF